MIGLHLLRTKNCIKLSFHVSNLLVVAVLPTMQLHFIDGTPKVEGNSARVELVVNESTASLLCELLTQEKLDSPMVANCEW